MTTCALAVPPSVRLLGDQRPRLWSVPSGAVSSEGQRAVDLAAEAGLELDDWQQFVLRESLNRTEEWPEGRWSAFEVGLIVGRQNGKGTILEARELAGLFLLGERLILHSAHEFKTAAEAFRRIESLISGNRSFRREVSRIRTQTGAEAIELRNGARLRFVARSSGSGRGFSGDLVILDEAQKLDDKAMAALLPTLSARPDPQLWYTASAGDLQSIQLGRIRDRGLTGNDPSLAFFEWSAEHADDPADPVTWARANPGLGIRIDQDYIARERAALSSEAFERERLSIGQYPSDRDGWLVISEADWISLADPQSQPEDPVAFAIAVDGSAMRKGAIAAAGMRADGLLHCELADYRPGTSWIVPRLAEMWRNHAGAVVIVDAAGHESSLIAPLEAAGVPVTKPRVRDVAAAFGYFYDAVTDAKSLRHLGQPQLDAAVAAAVTRDVGDAGRSWGRRVASGDISPLVAATLACWGASTGSKPFYGGWR